MLLLQLLPSLAANCSNWLTQPCATPSTLAFNASASTFTLSNGIVSRTLLLDAAQQLSTVSLRSEASGQEKLRAVVAEAALEINGALALVGGSNTTNLRFKFATHRLGTPVAGGFAFSPGSRGSRAGKPWPPSGVRAEFDHVLPCAAVGAGEGAAQHITATVVYELYDATSAFGKRLLLRHNCTAPLFVFNMSVSLLALARDLGVETFTDASIAEAVVDGTDAPAPGVGVWGTRFLPIAASHSHDSALPAYGPGLSFFTSADSFTSFLCVEVVHDAERAGGAAHGMSEFGLESARMWRTLAPQTEQFPVTANAM